MPNNVKVTITGDNKLKPVLDQAGNQLGNFEGAVGKVQAALKGLAVGYLVKQLVDFAGSTLDVADNLNKMSQRTGVSVEELSGLQHAAQLADVDSQAFEKSLKKLAVTLSDAHAGMKEAKDNLAALGVSATDAQGKVRSTSDVLAQIADKFQKTKDGADKAALATKVFGKAGTEMIPLLNQGSAGLKQMQEEAKRLGIVLSTEDAQAAEDFHDNITRLQEAARGLMQNFLSGLLPALNQTFAAMSGSGDDAFAGAKTAGEALGTVVKYLVLGFESLAIGIDFAAHKLGLFVDATLALASFDAKGFAEKFGMLVGSSTDAQGDALRQQLGKFEQGLFDPQASGGKKGAGGGDDDIKRRNDEAEALQKARWKADIDAAREAAAVHKKLIDEEGQRLDQLREHDLISVKDYYEKKKRMAIEATEFEIAKLEEEVAIATQMRDKAADEKDKIAAATELNKLLEEQAAKKRELNRLNGKDSTGAADPLAQQAEAMQLAADQAQEVERKINAVFADLETQQQRIQYLVSTRQMSEMEGEKELNKLRADAADKVGGMVDDYQRLAQASGNPEIIQNADRIRLAHEELGHTINKMRDTIIDAAQSSFENFFSSIITGSVSAGQAFKNLASSILSSIAQMIAKMLAMWAVQKLIGLFFPSAGGGGGIATSIGAGSSGGFGFGTGIGSGPIQFPVAMHALGGGVDGPTIVGERGPELFVPGQSGVIFGNDKVRNMGGRESTIYIDARGAESGVEEKIVAGMRQAATIGGVMGYSATREEARRGR
jgi:lambda family phage tail tape measure protein